MSSTTTTDFTVERETYTAVDMSTHGLLNTRPSMLPNEISNIESVQSTGFKFGTHIFQGDSNTPWEYQPHENKIGGNMGIFLKIFKGL